MLAGLAAEAVLIVHLLFILFVMLGAIGVMRWPRLLWLHLPAVAWGIYIEFSGKICPLTPLENHLRHLAGQAGYQGDFISQYLLPILYPPGLDSATQWMLGGLVILVNLVLYGLMVVRARKQP